VYSQEKKNSLIEFLMINLFAFSVTITSEWCRIDRNTSQLTVVSPFLLSPSYSSLSQLLMENGYSHWKRLQRQKWHACVYMCICVSECVRVSVVHCYSPVEIISLQCIDRSKSQNRSAQHCIRLQHDTIKHSTDCTVKNTHWITESENAIPI
jgi:hypothetical protein